jgi:hypothetical protein
MEKNRRREQGGSLPPSAKSRIHKNLTHLAGEDKMDES